MRKLSSQIATHLHKLQRLGLTTALCRNITDETLTLFTNQITSRLTNLDDLKLCFNGIGRITDQSLTNLAIQIQTHLKVLRSLWLHFSGGTSQITDQSLIDLAEQIRNIASLKYFYLSLSGPNITFTGWMNFISDIGKRPSTLQTLFLSIKDCPRISKTELESFLAQQVSQNQHLTNVRLDFNYLQEMTDEWFLTLATYLGIHYPKITNLQFDFWVCQKVTDKSLRSLIDIIQTRFLNLKKLNCYFDSSYSAKETVFLEAKKLLTDSLPKIRITYDL